MTSEGQRDASRDTSDGSDSEALSRVIGAFYDAALDPALWPDALRLSTVFVGGVAANLFWQHPVAHQAMVFHAWGDNPDYVRSYLDRYAILNPLYPAATFVEPGVVFSGGDIVPHEAFRQTRFFREWVEPQGFIDVVGVNLHRFSMGVAAFTIRRSTSQGVVDAEVRRRMDLLVPHVYRALMIGREIESKDTHAARLETVLEQVAAGVFLLDGAGRIEFANGPGTDLIARGDMLHRSGDRLVARDPAVDPMLRSAVQSAAQDGDGGRAGLQRPVAMTDRDGSRHLAHVLPLASRGRLGAQLDTRAAAAVFVRRADIPIVTGVEAVAARHRLTPGEIRVLEAVLAMGSREEIADALGLSVSTVKTHLAALFHKTGTQRRADLVKIVAAAGTLA